MLADPVASLFFNHYFHSVYYVGFYSFFISAQHNNHTKNEVIAAVQGGEVNENIIKTTVHTIL